VCSRKHVFTCRSGKPFGSQEEGATDEEVEQAARKAEIPSLHHESSAEIRHLGRRTRRYAVGRAAPAHAIARAIVRNPSILLLDEATSALEQTPNAINRTLLKVAKGRTMIFSTHRLTSVVDMDEIIVISGGQGDRARLACQAARRQWRVSKAVDDQGYTPMTGRSG